ncbi:DUF4376 domain-containing protein [Pantoea sp. 18069]|uniref:DUF4376 domain-containing protein n=1 Tax=Pantoea sp. 18069 TaxID=2681415 RepID=UPI00135800A5|nr:DUF4376 domain-containing protein [Pantoea sp. 18069]
MPILKVIQTPNGITAAHRVVLATLNADLGNPSFKLQLHSYPTEEDAINNQNLLWQEYPALPVTAFDPADPTASFERALIEDVSSDYAGGTWVPATSSDDLELAKLRKWAEVKGERDRLESGGFDVPGWGCFDSDSESRNRISGAVMAAKIARDASQPYAINWTLADNSTAQLDADGIINVGFTLLAHVDGIHQRSRALFAEIHAAETTEAVDAIQWASPQLVEPVPDAVGELAEA